MNADTQELDGKGVNQHTVRGLSTHVSMLDKLRKD